MIESNPETDPEFSAMHTVYTTLNQLDADARSRVINYVMARLNIVSESMPKSVDGGDTLNPTSETENSSEGENCQHFDTFAELYDATRPTTNAHKALVAGYWLQVCQNADNFDSLSVNNELKNLGEQLSHISDKFNWLKNQQPALVLQLKKSGKTQQARKTYKVTTAGIKIVRNMIDSA